MSNALDHLIALGKRRRVHTLTLEGVTIAFRGLSAYERREWYEFSTTDSGRLESDNMLVAMALCNADGSPQFVDDESRKNAMNAVSHLDPVEVIKPLVRQIMIASGMAEAEELIEKK